MLIFVTGGIKSGKSLFAESILHTKKDNIYYAATAVITDAEMENRVAVHKSRRPAHWTTIEENYNLENIINSLPQEKCTVLIDCLTTLLTNRLWRDNPELFDKNMDTGAGEKILAELGSTAKNLAESKHEFIVVSNEVGQSLIPPTFVGRFFCDLQGKANQIFAQNAQEVYFTVSGIPIKIK